MIFDYQCLLCNEVQKDIFVHTTESPVACSKCGGETLRLFPTRFSAHVFPSEGVHLEHVEPNGKTFYSKKEMRQYAKEHNLELGAL